MKTVTMVLVIAGLFSTGITLAAVRGSGTNDAGIAPKGVKALGSQMGKRGGMGFRRGFEKRKKACEGLSEGDSCTFTRRGGKSVTGTCRMGRRHKVLICRRAGRGRRGGHMGSMGMGRGMGSDE
ncbi:hypothetical protein KKF84_16270 [Myxococcota bacterium]|nr:hypothetical protein [Myxococcota bacterium]MBU1536881.1 hypothetical protein [Myxococcota bacterium]